MSRVTANISTSLDGFVCGPNDSRENPLGDGGERLHEWVYDLASWREQQGLDGGETNRDSEIFAESFIAGTASCRVGVEAADELHTSLHPDEIIHPNAPLRDTEYGTREFTVLDPDRNSIAFFERE